MSVLVTGAAGFIGSHVARALLARGEAVVGVDNFSNYYDPVLKFARLKPLRDDKSFIFLEADIADRDAMLALAEQHRDLDRIVHLAAQPGVRHSLVDPYIYVRTNVMAHLFGLKAIGLRYFTVYGPWGRPDMSPYIFAKAIHEGRPIELYHLGFVKRDYSYIDDIVAGTLAVLDKPGEAAGHRLYNLGAARSEDIMTVIALFEKALGRKAEIELKPGDPFDMQETAAEISDTTRDFGWKPKVSVEEGIPLFVDWFKDYNRL